MEAGKLRTRQSLRDYLRSMAPRVVHSFFQDARGTTAGFSGEGVRNLWLPYRRLMDREYPAKGSRHRRPFV